MKKLLLLLSFLLAYCISFAQYPITQNLGAPKTLVVSKGGLAADSTLILPYFTDTLAANLSPYIKNYPGNMIFLTSLDQIWVRNSTATKWLLLAVSGGTPGTVTSISQGYGMTNTPNPLTTSGTIKVDTTASTGLSGKYLRIIDTSKLVSKTQSILTTSPLTGGGNLSTSRTISIPQSSSSTSGYLSSGDWTTFNSKVATSRTISTTSPLTGGGDLSANLTLSIPAASSTINGYLSSSSFNTFSKKVDTIYRKTGKDSIYISANGVVYQIKDSIGGGGSVSISQGYGILNSPNPITGTGTITIDSSTLSTKYLRLNDTSRMLAPYLRKIDTTNKFVNRITRTPGIDSIYYYIGSTQYAIKDSSGGGGTLTRAVDTIFRTSGKDSIYFKIAGITYRIKDSVGSGGGGGTPAGSNGYVQFNNSGSFGADSSLFWNNTNKRLGLGTTQPENKFDIVSGNQTGKMNRGFYETATFSRDGDNKVGIYNAGNYNGSGSSIAFGNIKNKNSSNYYPGFELQNVNDSETVANSFMRYNFTQRDSTGQVLDAAIDLMNINADGKVVINGNGAYSSVPVTARLVVGSDNTGSATLETSGSCYVQDYLTVAGDLTNQTARYKPVTFLDDNDIGETYDVTYFEHIIIYSTNLDNCSINLPAYPNEGRELVIKQAGDVNTYRLYIYANGHNIVYDDPDTSSLVVADTPPHSTTLIYHSGLWYVLTY